MNSQPNEIITHILSYLDNHTLMFARGVCHKWKHLIETRIFYKATIPKLYVCIATNDYYHFGKYYLNYNYDTEKVWVISNKINDAIYYTNLVRILANKEIFYNGIPPTTLMMSIIMSIEQLLIYASYKGHLEIVEYLISIGADFHVYNDFALRSSADNGHLEVVKYLIRMGANLHVDEDYALRWSANAGHLEIVKYLISIGADLHAANDCALRWSAENGHLEIVKYLISIGADRHTNNDYIFRYGKPNVIEFLKSISKKN